MVLWPRVPTDFVDPTDATMSIDSWALSVLVTQKKKNLEK